MLRQTAHFFKCKTQIERAYVALCEWWVKDVCVLNYEITFNVCGNIRQKKIKIGVAYMSLAKTYAEDG